MNLVLLIGIQASGKSSFRRQRFAGPHVVVSLDEINASGNVKHAREREAVLLGEAMAAQRNIVVDNCNPTREDRARYIAAAKQAGYRVIGYYMRSDLKECLERNAGRARGEQVPPVALKATVKKLERPSHAEGFDELYYVYLDRKNRFIVGPYRE